MHHKPWPESEVKILIELQKKYKPIKCASIMGRTYDSVRRKIERLIKQGTIIPSNESIDIPDEIENPAKLRNKPSSSSQSCPVCEAPVEEWTDHINRFGWYACKKES
jgi:hypothetical protein